MKELSKLEERVALCTSAIEKDTVGRALTWIPCKDCRNEAAQKAAQEAFKPLYDERMAWLARLVTPPGGTVLDPFMGSGTVGAAALPQGFCYVGIEVDPHYVQIAEARVAYWGAKQGMDAWDELVTDTEEEEDPQP